MKTITVASAKGGSGKSTLVAALAVRACQDGRVALMDLDLAQASLTSWHQMRGRFEAPALIQEIDRIPRTVKALALKFDWLLVDTPPHGMDIIEQAVAVADAVVIPVRPGLFDVLSVQTVAEMAREHMKPFAFALTCVDGRFKALTRQALTALADLGATFETQTSYRAQWVAALTTGKTGPEIEKALRPEIGGLWAEVKALAEKGSRK